MSIINHPQPEDDGDATVYDLDAGRAGRRDRERWEFLAGAAAVAAALAEEDARLLAAARARGYGSIREMFRADSAAALAARTVTALEEKRPGWSS